MDRCRCHNGPAGYNETVSSPLHTPYDAPRIFVEYGVHCQTVCTLTCGLLENFQICCYNVFIHFDYFF